MAASKGKTVLIAVGDGATSETFATIGGLRTSSFTINNQTVDITTKDSNQWRELLEGGGISSMSISGDGIFDDGASIETLRGYLVADTINNFEITVNSAGDKYSGAFQVTSFGMSGGYDDAVTYTLSLESAGTITYTAA